MATTAQTTPVVTVHFWGVSSTAIPGSLLRMASGRRKVRRSHGLRFAKLIGTGSGNTFSVRNADLHHWGLVAAWDDIADARVFELTDLVTKWDRSSFEKARFVLSPIHSRGQWSGKEPFGPGMKPTADGPVAAITRAKIRPKMWSRFAAAIPPVADATAQSPGLLIRTGIGEAPIGLQGTFSVWQSGQALNDFISTPEHRHVVGETQRLGWYSEELFARFTVGSASGAFCGQPVEIGHDID